MVLLMISNDLFAYTRMMLFIHTCLVMHCSNPRISLTTLCRMRRDTEQERERDREQWALNVTLNSPSAMTMKETWAKWFALWHFTWSPRHKHQWAENTKCLGHGQTWSLMPFDKIVWFCLYLNLLHTVCMNQPAPVHRLWLCLHLCLHSSCRPDLEPTQTGCSTHCL